MFLDDEELNREPNRGIGMEDFRRDGLEDGALKCGVNEALLMVLVAFLRKSMDLKNVENGGSFMGIYIVQR